MPVNRNALIRYKTIDKCLQNKYRQWTLDDLIEACSDALYDFEGIDKGISKRTVQADIQMMRSDKLGYNAPIIVKDRKYYTYENPDYSITNIPLTEEDLSMLSESVEFMKQFQGFSHFQELNGMVQKLEDHIYAQKTHSKPVIDFEKNDNLKGLDFLDTIYKAIVEKKAISITYQSFKARTSNTFDFHPYLLKEYRNRWFAIGCKKKREGIMNLALDRIVQTSPTSTPFKANPDFDPETYFKNVLGVTVNSGMEVKEVILYVKRKQADYVLTKPLHYTQKLIGRDYYGITISLNVLLNFELEKEILGFGENVRVIAPDTLKRNIRERIEAASDFYHTQIEESGFRNLLLQLGRKGFSILNHVYTKREINKITSFIENSFKNDKQFAQRQLLKKLPQLWQLLLNKNLFNIVSKIDPQAFLTKAIFFDKPQKNNWYVTWHQDIPINVKNKIETKGFSGWTFKEEVTSVCPPEAIQKNTFTIRIHLDETNESNGALKVIPGSHNKRLNHEEIRLITENSMPYSCYIGMGGIQIMKPLLLHSSPKSLTQKKRRVIHLEFSSSELPNGLEWEEKEILH